MGSYCTRLQDSSAKHWLVVERAGYLAFALYLLTEVATSSTEVMGVQAGQLVHDEGGGEAI
jgi:hypothetical protein